MMLKKEWFNPKARVCWECPTLEAIKDKQTGSVDQGKKFCPRFGWLIVNKLAQSQAVCRVSREIKRRHNREP
jgi:hypothetical protein